MLKSKKCMEVVWIREDDWAEMNDYKEKHGDPLKNGKGHIVQPNPDGVPGVIIPNGKMKVQTADRSMLDIDKVVDDGSLLLSPTQLEDAQSAMWQQMSPRCKRRCRLELVKSCRQCASC